jgi:transposase-like protein
MFDQKPRTLSGANKTMVTIATFNEPAKAKQLKERFQQAGLRADVHNENHLQQVAFMSKPRANVKVKVEEKDFEEAQRLMVEWEATDPGIASALIRCPQCGSSSIEYPQLTRKFLTPAVASVLFALKIFQKEFYCENCHFTWSLEEERAFFRLWRRFFPGRELDNS